VVVKLARIRDRFLPLVANSTFRANDAVAAERIHA